MRDFAKLAVGAAAAASMVISPVALAQSTRAAAALPSAKAATSAPVSGVRASSQLTKKSELAKGVIVLIVVAGAAAGYGLYKVIKDSD